MSSPKRLIACLMLLGLPLAVSACAAPTAVIRPLFPPSADLQVEPKPVPPADIVTSAQAAAQYDIALEAHGDRVWLQVARLCRWFREQGMPGIVCPAAQ